jgi:tetratricopeptide (TPR) repeat protein
VSVHEALAALILKSMTLRNRLRALAAMTAFAASFGSCERTVTPPSQVGAVTVIRANALLEEKKYTEALAAYDEILKTNPTDMDSLFGKAFCYQMLGSDTAAVAAYQQAVTVAQVFAFKTNYNLGSLHVHAKRFAEGLPYLRAAMKLTPGSFEAHYNLGFALEGVGDLKGSLQEFEESVRILPKNAPAIFNLGRMKERLGKKTAAKQSYRIALELDPNLLPAREALERMK